MQLNLGRMDLFIVAVLVAALAFISWQVNQTARAVSAASTWAAHMPAQPALLNPSLSSSLRPVPYCQVPGAQAQSGAQGNDGDDDDDSGDAPDDPSQDVFPT